MDIDDEGAVGRCRVEVTDIEFSALADHRGHNEAGLGQLERGQRPDNSDAGGVETGLF